MGCGSSKPQGSDGIPPSYPVTNTTALPTNYAAPAPAPATQTAQPTKGGKKKKAAINLSFLSAI